MIPCVVITHGQLANEMVASAEMIVGEIEHITPLCLGWKDDVNESREEIAGVLESLILDRGAIIMTDMFGGTPSNLAISFLGEKKVEVLTGVNLPMIIKAANQAKDETLTSLAEKICDKGKSSITVASRFLEE
jgi:PTS system mannose-specific IIA component